MKTIEINHDVPLLEVIPSEDALIRIERLPEVEEFFSAMYDPVLHRINDVLSAECTEETRLQAESARAEVRRFKADIKAALKKAENQLFEPWERVLEKANNLTALCDKADVELKNRIDDVKHRLKKAKSEELISYFEEKCAVLNLDWIEFDRVVSHIRLNDTVTKLRKIIDLSLEKIANDVTAISKMEHAAEIMSEYKMSLNISNAINTIQSRKHMIAAEEALLSIRAAEQEKQEAHTESVLKAVREVEEKSEQLHAPTVKQAADEIHEADVKQYTMSFTVRGTLDNLKALKKWITENNIEIIN